MAPKPDSEQTDHAEAVALMARSAAKMTAASMYGASLMTQAYGLWMGSIARLLEDAPHAGATGPDKPSETSEAPNAASRDSAETMAPARRAEAGAPTPQRRQASADRAVEAVASSARSDDLKRIAGIGPKLEKLLKKEGISTYEQIADLTPKGAEMLDRRLNLHGRIAQDKWVEAAKMLAQRTNA